MFYSSAHSPGSDLAPSTEKMPDPIRKSRALSTPTRRPPARAWLLRHATPPLRARAPGARAHAQGSSGCGAGRAAAAVCLRHGHFVGRADACLFSHIYVPLFWHRSLPGVLDGAEAPAGWVRGAAGRLLRDPTARTAELRPAPRPVAALRGRRQPARPTPRVQRGNWGQKGKQPRSRQRRRNLGLRRRVRGGPALPPRRTRGSDGETAAAWRRPGTARAGSRLARPPGGAAASLGSIETSPGSRAPRAASRG